MNLPVVLVHPKAKLPEKATGSSAGYDIFSVEEVTIAPGERARVNTGIVIGVPENHEAQVRPRSGLAFKNGITVLNSPGTIDADYRSFNRDKPEDSHFVQVLLFNAGKEEYTVKVGDRIAQLVFQAVKTLDIWQVEAIPPLDGRVGGFGSTGR